MKDRAERTWCSAASRSTGPILAGIFLAVFMAVAGNGHASTCGDAVVYEGKGAGQVLFDGKLHAAKGLTCADCHEGEMFSPALFSMQKGSNDITMRKMELGRSCGHCHEVSMKDTLSCDKCHKKMSTASSERNERRQ